MFATFFFAALTAWTGVAPENHLGGRKISEGYLQGKVVLVHRWHGAVSASRDALPRMEKVWQSYKMKSFVLLGSHGSGNGSVPAAQSAVREYGLTYPVYGGADIKDGVPLSDRIPYYYVVDATGHVAFSGTDGRLAEAAVVNALTNLASPPDIGSWRRLIDFELDVLPGRAYLHLMEFRKRFPAAAKAYDEVYRRLRADAEVVKLARLEAFSREAKDFDPNAKTHVARSMLQKIGRTVKAYESLKESDDPVKVQEAKNCLADLIWAAIALKARLKH